VAALESSMPQNRPRALVQMATGAGKTFLIKGLAWISIDCFDAEAWGWS